jgi:hypothetical protein
MTALKSRSEGVALRPFSGLEALESFLETQVKLKVASNVGEFLLQHRESLGLAAADIERLGLSVSVENVGALHAVVDPLVMDLDDVSLLVVAIDRKTSVLRENVVLLNMPVRELKSETVLTLAGGESPHRILGNKRSGFRLELALVQNRDVAGENAVRPRKKGALIGLASWEVKPVTDGDSIQPEVLTDNARQALGLSKNTWMYFEAKPDLLASTDFENAASFYVDQNLLEQVQVLTGDALTLAEMLLYSSAVTQLIYEYSFALRDVNSDLDQDEFSESQVFRLLRKKFNSKTDSEIIDLVKDEPARAVSEFMANANDFKSLLGAVTSMNGATNELSDFED